MFRPPAISPDATEVARAIYDRMVAKKWGQTRLDSEAGLKEGYSRDLFRGKSKSPQTEQVAKIARALGCRVEDLDPRWASGEPEIGEVVDSPSEFEVLADSEKSLLRLWRILKPSAKRLVMAAMRDMIPRPFTGQEADDI